MIRDGFDARDAAGNGAFSLSHHCKSNTFGTLRNLACELTIHVAASSAGRLMSLVIVNQ
jgi:hypothetical protein